MLHTMGLKGEATAALIFLILYAILFVFLLLGCITGRIRVRSRYCVIIFYVIVRLAAQATGVAFSIVGNSATNLLIAYFILGVESNLVLVLCTYRFLISWQNQNTLSHDSWLEPRLLPGTPGFKRFLASWGVLTNPPRPMAIMHIILNVAIAIIITGGSMLAGGHDNVQDFNPNMRTAKALRIAGQSIFFSITVFLLYCIYDAMRQSKREHPSRHVHPTLYLLLATWPLLFVRGLYGVLSSFVTIFNYFSPTNYGEHGLTNSFVVSEYTLSTMMEWISCLLLMLTYVTSLNDPKEGNVKECCDVGKETSTDGVGDA